MRHRAFTGELSWQKRKNVIMQVVIFILTRKYLRTGFLFSAGFPCHSRLKNATMQRHSKEECKPCILSQGQPAMLHSLSEILLLHGNRFCNLARQKKNATMQPHSKKNANPASFLRDNLQCCTLHMKNFRYIATRFVIL